MLINISEATVRKWIRDMGIAVGGLGIAYFFFQFEAEEWKSILVAALRSNPRPINDGVENLGTCIGASAIIGTLLFGTGYILDTILSYASR